MAITRETVVLDEEAGWFRRFEIEVERNLPGQAYSVDPTVKRGNVCVAIAYGSGTEKQRQGSRLPAVLPADARKIAAALVRAAEIAEGIEKREGATQ
jgi:hypothetical protein